MYASENHARLMLAISIAMCLLIGACLLAFTIALPINAGGRTGLFWAFVGFLPGLLAWGASAISAWRSLRRPGPSTAGR